MKKLMLLHGLAVLLLLTASCNGEPAGNDRLRADADSFATCYFNWQFQKAAGYADDSSSVWIEYMASQVHQADVGILRDMQRGACVSIGDIEWRDNDSMAYVDLTIENFAHIDTIGKAAHIVGMAKVTIPMRYSNGRWKAMLRSAPYPKEYHSKQD